MNKAKCEQWFIKHQPSDELVDKMLIKIQEALKTKQWSDKQFIPYPYTWLNNKGWENEYLDETANSTPYQAIINDDGTCGGIQIGKMW